MNSYEDNNSLFSYAAWALSVYLVLDKERRGRPSRIAPRKEMS